ncbi:iron ABC transporter permease [Arthrobacter sp. Marseille-P9274]|uniref:ABC transporter permease n=1 Tax=Arthrobacter sp. Marseille-P9274 TaxID=2866572 RepID=UPI0021C9D499|nr:iron ABC transporter permease [Arthrobacter sp. Marseille-P9274]
MLVALSVLVIFLVAYPLVQMFQRAGGPFDAWAQLISEPWFSGMLLDTAAVVGISAFLSLAIGALLAWVNERTDAGLGPVGDALPLIPLFLPAVALAVGWVALASPEVGLLSNILEPLGFQIYSTAGMVLVYVLLTVPYTYLPIVSALRSLDPSLEEAARASGASTLRVVWTVSLPAVAPSLLSGFILATIIGAGVYSVPAIVGQNTDLDIMSVRIVRSIQNSYPVDYGTAVRLSVLLLAVLLVLYYLQHTVISKQRFARMGGQAPKVARIALGRWCWPVRMLGILYILCAAVLPLAAVIYLSLQRYWQPDIFAPNWTLENFSVASAGAGGAMEGIRNSVILGVGAGMIVVLAATMILTYARQSNNWVSRVANGAAKFPAVVPGSVLAVSFIFAFGGAPFDLGGTLLIMGMAYFVSFLPYAVISLEGTSAQIDGSLEDASRLCGAGQGRTFGQVVLPLLRPGLLATFALVFVRIVGDLEVAVLLGTGQTPMASALLFQVWSEGFFTQVAAIAVMMTAVSAVVVIFLMWFSRPGWVRKMQARNRKATGR